MKYKFFGKSQAFLSLGISNDGLNLVDGVIGLLRHNRLCMRQTRSDRIEGR